MIGCGYITTGAHTTVLVKGNNPDEKNPKPIGLQLQSTASGLHSSIESNGQISLQGQKMIRSVCYFDLKTHPNP